MPASRADKRRDSKNRIEFRASSGPDRHDGKTKAAGAGDGNSPGGGESLHPEVCNRLRLDQETVPNQLSRPAFGRPVERLRQANGHVGSAAGPSVRDGRQRIATDAQRFGGAGATTPPPSPKFQ